MPTEASLPSELGVRTGRLSSGVDDPPLGFAYRVGELFCRPELPWLVNRVDDLAAERLEKMFLESFRIFGDAGDSGMLWKEALGNAKSNSFGDLGLLGLMGVLACSFPLFERMATNERPGLGILRNGVQGGFQGYWVL